MCSLQSKQKSLRRSCCGRSRKAGGNQIATDSAVSRVEVTAYRMIVSNTLTSQVSQPELLEDPQYKYDFFFLIGEGVLAERIRTLGSSTKYFRVRE